MKTMSMVQLLCLLAALIASAASCPDFTWGDNCEYQSCGCDGKNADTCPGGTVDGLPCCEYCPAAGWNCKCGDGCEGTDNCCMYCPSRYLGVGEEMKPFFLMQKPDSIVKSLRAATSPNSARNICPYGTELLYINSVYAEAELEKYINDNLQVQGDETFYLGGYVPTQSTLANWREWGEVSRNQASYCLVVSNHFAGTNNKQSWEVRTAPCSETSGGHRALCKNTNDYYGMYYEAMDAYRTRRKQDAYFTGEVVCKDNNDPFVNIYSEADAEKLFNELERRGLDAEKFFLRGYSNKAGTITVADIIQAPVKRGQDQGTYCVMFRTDRANGTRRKWKLYATRCTDKYATISVCWKSFFYELY